MRHELCRWSSFGRNFSVWMLPFRCPLKNVLILRKSYTVDSAVAVFSAYSVFTVGCSANLWPAAQSRPGFYPAQSSSQGGAGADKETVVSCVRMSDTTHRVIMSSCTVGPPSDAVLKEDWRLK